MKKFFAFTVAETLIVMGIIGIVSALTLPNLNASTGEKEKVAKVKKLYSNLNDAVGRAVAVYGPIDEWFLTDTTLAAQTTRFGERITEFIKVSKNCGLYTSGDNCFNSNITYIDGTTETGINSSNTYQFTLADGSSVAVNSLGSNAFWVFVDIDGLKGANKMSKDVFTFGVDSSNLVYTYKTSGGINSALTTGAIYQTGWVIDYENMDYLKTDSSGKCPNGKVLNTLANPPVITCK